MLKRWVEGSIRHGCHQKWALVVAALTWALITSLAASLELDCTTLYFHTSLEIGPYISGEYVRQPSLYLEKPVYAHSCTELYIYSNQSEPGIWILGPIIGLEAGFAVSHDHELVNRQKPARWKFWSEDSEEWAVHTLTKLYCLETVCQRFLLSGSILSVLQGTYSISKNVDHPYSILYNHDNHSSIHVHRNKYGVSESCDQWNIVQYQPNESKHQTVIISYENVKFGIETPRSWAYTSEMGVSHNPLLDITCLEYSSFEEPNKDGSPEPVTETTHTTQSSENEGCGIRQVASVMQRSLLLVGSARSTKGKWPWMVAILDDEQKLKCGGALLSERWILTAAHCFSKSISSYQNYSIYVGAHNLDEDWEDSRQNASIKEIYFHPNYTDFRSPFRVSDDLALIEVDDLFTMTQYVQPVCLPSESDSSLTEGETPSDCHVIGWGQRSYSGTKGGILGEQTTTLSNISACVQQSMRRVVADPTWMTDTNTFCAHPNNLSGKVCKGDSGSPLICDRQGRWTLIGIASWSITICVPTDIPSIYSDVAAYLNWIDQIMNITSSN